MNARTLVLGALFAAALAGCATQEAQKPAPPPAPAPAPAPAPQPAPVAAPAPKPEPKPEAKKPAVINLSSTELFEFNKATLTPQARELLDREVLPKLRDLADLRYVNV